MSEHIENLESFLVKAKKNTYATAGEGGEKRLEDGSKELTYEENGFKYRDRYFGSSNFIGEEAIWYKSKVVWGMNYYGKVSAGEDTGKTYDFLKKALQTVKEDRPFRGPPSFKAGELEYFNNSEGTVSEFNGRETISLNGKQIYYLHYHGGTI